MKKISGLALLLLVFAGLGSAADVINNNPDGGDVFYTDDVDINFEALIDHDGGTVRLYIDGNEVYSQGASTTGGNYETYSSTENVQGVGPHDFYWEIEEQSSTTQGPTETIYLQEPETFTSLTSQTTDNYVFDNVVGDTGVVSSDNVLYSYGISESDGVYPDPAGIDGGEARLYVDGSQVDTETLSSSENVFTSLSSGDSIDYGAWTVENIGESNGNVEIRVSDGEAVLNTFEMTGTGTTCIKIGCSVSSGPYEQAVLPTDGGGDFDDQAIVINFAGYSGSTVSLDLFHRDIGYFNQTGLSSGQHTYYAELYSSSGSLVHTTATKSFTYENPEWSNPETTDGLVNFNHLRPINYSGTLSAGSSGPVSFVVEYNSNGSEYFRDQFATHSAGSTTEYNYTKQLPALVNSDVVYDFYFEYTSDSTSNTYESQKIPVTVSSANSSMDVNNTFPSGVLQGVPRLQDFKSNVTSWEDGNFSLYLNGTEVYNESWNPTVNDTVRNNNAVWTPEWPGYREFNWTQWINQTGDLNFTAYYDTDTILKSDTTILDVNQTPDDRLALTYDSPSNGDVISDSLNVDFEYSVDTTDLAGTSYILLNGSSIYNQSHSFFSFQNVDFLDQDIDPGYYVSRIRYIDENGKYWFTDYTNFTVRPDPNVTYTVTSPANGSQVSSANPVQFDFDLSSDDNGSIDVGVKDSQGSTASFYGADYTEAPNNQTFTNTANLDEDTYTWDIEYTSEYGYVEDSKQYNFEVINTTYIRNVEYQYLNVSGGGGTNRIRLNLSGSDRIDSHNTVTGDTVVFNNDTWIIENFTVPYSDEFAVFDTAGENDTYTANFDRTDQGYGQDNTRNSDVVTQFIDRVVNITNNGNRRLYYRVEYDDLAERKNIVQGLKFTGNIPGSSNTGVKPVWSVDYVDESSSKSAQSFVREGEKPTISINGSWSHTGSLVGFNNLNQTYTLSSTYDSIESVVVNGSRIEGTSLVNASGGEVNVGWNQTLTVGETIDTEVNYTEPAPYVIENTPTQVPTSIFNNVTFYERDFVVNPGSSQLTKIGVNVSVYNSTLAGTSKVVDELSRTLQSSLDTSNNIVSFNVSNLAADSDRRFNVSYKMPALNIADDNYTVSDGRVTDVFELNLTNPTNVQYKDLNAYVDLEDDDRITDTSLSLNGSSIALDPDYDYDRIDTDGNGFGDRAVWTVPTINAGQRQDYKLNVFRGLPLLEFEETIVTNKPVEQGKFIQFRKGLKYWNRNNFDLDVSRRINLPDDSFNVQLDGSSVDLRQGQTSSYIPLEFTADAQSNSTFYVAYSTPGIEVNKQKFTPDQYWINETNYNYYNVTFTNTLPTELNNVQASVSIIEGSDLDVVVDGEVLREAESVTGEYTFNISNVSGQANTVATVNYTIPVGNTSFVGRQNVSNGDTLSVWDIDGQSPVTLRNVKFRTDKFTCVQAQRAYRISDNSSYEIQCRGDYTVVVLGNVEDDNDFQLGIEHRPYIPVVDDARLVLRQVGTQLVVLGAVSFFIILGLAFWRSEYTLEDLDPIPG